MSAFTLKKPPTRRAVDMASRPVIYTRTRKWQTNRAATNYRTHTCRPRNFLDKARSKYQPPQRVGTMIFEKRLLCRAHVLAH